MRRAVFIAGFCAIAAWPGALFAGAFDPLGFGAAALTDENKGFKRFLEVAEKVADRLGAVDALVFGDGLSAAGSLRAVVSR